MTDFLQANPLTLHHAFNDVGRDFVMGDLHGCRAMLDTLLDHVRFDPATDRLFSVGDLVDRGPDSAGCLELLVEPWFFPVLGNHDAMLLAYWSPMSGERQRMYRDSFLCNPGMEWVFSAHDLADQYVPLLERLPFVRVVGEGAQRFQILHAERRDNYGDACLSDADLDNSISKVWDHLHQIGGFGDIGDWRDHLLWGRSYIQAEQPNLFRRLETLDFTGHTPAVHPKHPESVIQIGKQVYLDTGAFAAHPESLAGLTLWDVHGDQVWRLLGNDQVLNCRRSVS